MECSYEELISSRFGSFNEGVRVIATRFGSVENLVKADEDTCVAVLGEAIAQRWIQERWCINFEKPHRFAPKDQPEAVMQGIVKYVQQLKLLDFEMVVVLYLNNNLELKVAQVLSKGAMGASVIDVPKIVSSAADTRAQNVVLVHNHPNGDLAPSEADWNATYKLHLVLHCAGIRLQDHLIVSDAGYQSMAVLPQWTTMLQVEMHILSGWKKLENRL